MICAGFIVSILKNTDYITSKAFTR